MSKGCCLSSGEMGPGRVCWVWWNLRWLSPWCAFLAWPLCREGGKVPYDFHRPSEDRYCDMSSGRRYESGSFGEKQEHGSLYGSLKWKLLFPWYLQKSRSALEILQVQHVALSANFLSFIRTFICLDESERKSPWVTQQARKIETDGLPVQIALQLMYTCTRSVLQQRKLADLSSLPRSPCLRINHINVCSTRLCALQPLLSPPTL